MWECLALHRAELASPKQREISQPQELLSKEEALHHRWIEVKDGPKVMALYQPPSCSCFVTVWWSPLCGHSVCLGTLRVCWCYLCDFCAVCDTILELCGHTPRGLSWACQLCCAFGTLVNDAIQVFLPGETVHWANALIWGAVR